MNVMETLDDCPASELIAPIVGERVPLFKDFSRDHVAVDYYVDDEDIFAVANGTVLRAGNNSFWGNWIAIKHVDGHATVYKHIAEWKVEQNDTVTAGDVIARSYSDSHFHFECIPDGTKSETKARFDC